MVKKRGEGMGGKRKEGRCIKIERVRNGYREKEKGRKGDIYIEREGKGNRERGREWFGWQ